MDRQPGKSSAKARGGARGWAESARSIWYHAPTIADRTERPRRPRAAARERYGLAWPGKAAALRSIESPAAACVRARPDLSIAHDAARHAIVEGDNLDVLKILRASSAGSFDLVYIDPPYNRGHDRLYPDDWSETRRAYGAHAPDGRRHAQWLSFMAPRLALARELVHARGIVAVSIDELEVARLRLLMDEIHGEEDFVAEIVVSLNPKGRQLAPHFATSHEYVLVYARDARSTALVAASTDGVDVRDFPREDEHGRFRLLPLRNTNKKFNPTSSRTMHFPIWAHPDDGRVRAEPFDGALEVRPVFGDGTSAVWRWSARRIASDHEHLLARHVRTANGPRLDVFQIDRWSPERTKKLRTIWTSDEIGSTDDAVDELKSLVGPVFPTPKPVGLVRRLLDTMPKDARVLDYFAGSGTTAQAVIEANAADGGTRRCVLVQTPEPTDVRSEAHARGLDTIAAIARARVRATIERLGARDVGFRAYEIGSANDGEARADDVESLIQFVRR